MQRALAVFMHDRECAEKARADAEWECLRAASELPVCRPPTAQTRALVRALRPDATRVWKSASADDLTTASGSPPSSSTHSARALVSSPAAASASLPAPLAPASAPGGDGSAHAASTAALDGDGPSTRVASQSFADTACEADIPSVSPSRSHVSPPPPPPPPSQSPSTASDSSCLMTVVPGAADTEEEEEEEEAVSVVRRPAAIRIFPLTSSSSLDDLSAEFAGTATAAASAPSSVPEHSECGREAVAAEPRDGHCHSFSPPPPPPPPPTTRDTESRSGASHRRFRACLGLEVPPPLTPSISRYLMPAGPGPLPRTLAPARSVFTFETSPTTFTESSSSSTPSQPPSASSSLAPIRENPVSSDADRNGERKTARGETKSGEAGSRGGGGDRNGGGGNVPVTGAPRKSRRLSLHMAACSGNISKVRHLLDNGCDVNARNQDGSTPLMWACRRGHWEVCHVLLAHEADAAARNSTGSTALHYAARCPVPSTASAAQRVDAVDERRSHASDAATADFVKRQRRVLRALVVAGAPVGWADEHGRTALHDATMRDAATLVDTLLAARADPNSPDRDNATPLHLACTTDRAHTLTNVVQLLDCRATVDLQDRHGHTSLHYAFACGADSVAAKLVSVGADLRDADSFVTSRDRVRQQALLAFAAVSVRAMLRAKRGRVRRLDARLADECFGVRAGVSSSVSSSPSSPTPAPPRLCRADLRWWSRHKRHHCYVCGYAFCPKCVQGARVDQMICATCGGLKEAADANLLSQSSSPPSPRSRRDSAARSGPPSRRGSLSSGSGGGGGGQRSVDDGRVSSSESSGDEGDGGDSDLEDSIDWGNGGEHRAGKIDGSASDGGGGEQRRRRSRRETTRDEDEHSDGFSALLSEASALRGGAIYCRGSGGGDNDPRRGSRPSWPVFEMPKNATTAIAAVVVAATTTATTTTTTTDIDACEEKRSSRADTALGRTLETSSSASSTRSKAVGALRLSATVCDADRELDLASQ